MAVSEEFLQYVLEQFRELGEVSSRKMFGGAGVYFDGKFFALVDDDELYLKVDDTNRPRFETAERHPFEPWAGHVMNGYWAVPVDVLEDPAALAEWSKHSIGIASSPSRMRGASRPRAAGKKQRKSKS